MTFVQRAGLALAAAVVFGALPGCHTGVENAIHRHRDDKLEQMLADNPGLVNERGTNGWPPLIYAARDGNAAAVRTLLAHGANPDQATDNGSTALMYAADNNRLTIAKTLIAHGANVNATDKDGHTPLSFAEDGRYTVMVDLLHSHGAHATGQR